MPELIILNDQLASYTRGRETDFIPGFCADAEKLFLRSLAGCYLGFCVPSLLTVVLKDMTGRELSRNLVFSRKDFDLIRSPGDPKERVYAGEPSYLVSGPFLGYQRDCILGPGDQISPYMHLSFDDQFAYLQQQDKDKPVKKSPTHTQFLLREAMKQTKTNNYFELYHSLRSNIFNQ